MTTMKKLNLIAVIGILAVALGAATAQANLITNGSFEEGTPPGQYLTVNAGGTAITGWTVGSGGVDYIGSYWQAADGSRSVDLSGNAPGFVSQSFATTAGATYTVSFYLAGNPDNSADKTIRVTYGPNENDFKDFTFTQAGHTLSNMGWVKEEFTFGGLVRLQRCNSHPPPGLPLVRPWTMWWWFPSPPAPCSWAPACWV
jgi:choice-of-anchor C domain-containing protein